jgi:flagellin-like hook-associated protein FlgL
LFTAAVVAFLSDGSIVFSNIVSSSLSDVGRVKGFSQVDVNGTAAGEGGTVAASSASAIFTNTENRLDLTISNLQGISASLGVNVAILQARSSFSANYSNTLKTGSDALTLADLNVEAANSQALALRQQLGIQSLSITGTQNASIITLLSTSRSSG